MAISLRRVVFLLVLAVALMVAAVLAGASQHQQAVQISAHGAPTR
jgi:hypothetical protein